MPRPVPASAPLLLRTGKALTWAVGQLREHGHQLPARLRGNGTLLALLTDPNCRRAALLRRRNDGVVCLLKFGTLTDREARQVVAELGRLAG